MADPCHSVTQSMELKYNNYADPYYSATCQTFATPEDLTADGIEALALWFRGKATNDNDSMFFALEDSDANFGIVTYFSSDDPNLSRTSWSN